jgi:hypothetical protein
MRSSLWDVLYVLNVSEELRASGIVVRTRLSVNRYE